MTDGGGSNVDAGSRVQNQLQFMNGFVSQAIKESVAVFHTGLNYSMNQGFRRDVDDEVCWPSNISVKSWNDQVESRMTPRFLIWADGGG